MVGVIGVAQIGCGTLVCMRTRSVEGWLGWAAEPIILCEIWGFSRTDQAALSTDNMHWFVQVTEWTFPTLVGTHKSKSEVTQGEVSWGTS